MWYAIYDDEPKGENINKAKTNIIEDMTTEDYIDFFLDNTEIAQKILHWIMNTDIFFEEFETEVFKAEENFFNLNAYCVENKKKG